MLLKRFSQSIVLLAALVGLAGCGGDVSGGLVAGAPNLDPSVVALYAARPNETYPVPAIDLRTVDPSMLRQTVAYHTTAPVGSIVVDTSARHLYLVQANGKALRYGVGVGKEGLAFRGDAVIARKADWPHWTPTPAMIKREPKRYGPYAAGLDGGLENPLGARALYLYRGDTDTHFRIHGTTEPETIGHAVSSGCIRMMDQDVIDLYSRVPTGTRVRVMQGGGEQS